MSSKLCIHSLNLDSANVKQTGFLNLLRQAAININNKEPQFNTYKKMVPSQGLRGRRSSVQIAEYDAKDLPKIYFRPSANCV